MIPTFNFRVHGNQEWDVLDDNIDVYIEVNAEKRYVYILTFFTLKNISTIMERHSLSGESANGTYFWASDMVILIDLQLNTIKIAIEDLIKSGELKKVALDITENH